MFTESYEGLIEFVMDEKSRYLPARYQLYMYLTSQGNVRKGNIIYTNLYGTLCEFAFKPFGFVLSIDNPNQLMDLSHVTEFKNYDPDVKNSEVYIVLNKYPTIYPFPLDFRSI